MTTTEYRHGATDLDLTVCRFTPYPTTMTVYEAWRPIADGDEHTYTERRWIAGRLHGRLGSERVAEGADPRRRSTLAARLLVDAVRRAYGDVPARLSVGGCRMIEGS